VKAQELKEFSTSDLISKEKTFKKDLFDLTYERKMGRVEKPSRFRLLKRDIARIQTVLREREIEDERSNNAKTK